MPIVSKFIMNTFHNAVRVSNNEIAYEQYLLSGSWNSRNPVYLNSKEWLHATDPFLKSLSGLSNSGGAEGLHALDWTLSMTPDPLAAVVNRLAHLGRTLEGQMNGN